MHGIGGQGAATRILFSSGLGEKGINNQYSMYYIYIHKCTSVFAAKIIMALSMVTLLKAVLRQVRANSAFCGGAFIGNYLLL